jgi:hypothetical protein
MQSEIQQENTYNDFSIYVNKCKQFIDIMINTRQWSGLTKNDVNRWLSNFRKFENEDEYIIYKLLTNIIYFSDMDIIYLLRDGIKNTLFNNIVLNAQISADFKLDNTQLLNITNNELNKTCFVPLLDSNSPHESGNYILRLLVQNGLIKPIQSVFPDKIEDTINFYDYKRIIIVDDCTGSGDQLIPFFLCKTMSNNTMTLIEWSKQHNIEVIYFVLFGYKQTISNLHESFLNEVKIYCLRELDESMRVFNDNSYIWDDVDERDYALSLIKYITQTNKITLYGYKDYDFSFIMDKTIPDWTLPIFWQKNENWQNLLNRKNSDVQSF